MNITEYNTEATYDLRDYSICKKEIEDLEARLNELQKRHYRADYGEYDYIEDVLEWKRNELEEIEAYLDGTKPELF